MKSLGRTLLTTFCSLVTREEAGAREMWTRASCRGVKPWQAEPVPSEDNDYMFLNRLWATEKASNHFSMKTGLLESPLRNELEI